MTSGSLSHRRDFCKSSSRSACPSRMELRATILRQAFEVYDCDNSGSIDSDELRDLLRDLGWPCHDEFLHRTVAVLDNDQSGTIDFTEFLSWTEFAYASRVLYPDEANDISMQSNSTTHGGSILRQGSYRGQLSRKDPSFPKSRLSAVWEEGPANSYRNANKASLRFGQNSILNSEEAPAEDGLTEEDVRVLNISEIAPPCPNAEERIEPKFSAKVTKMASMVLGRNRRNNSLHTSRIRSSSISAPTSRGISRVNDVDQLTESKMTVTMRWACGQFDDPVEDDVKPFDIKSRLPQPKGLVETQLANSSQHALEPGKSDAKPMLSPDSSAPDHAESADHGDGDTSPASASDFGAPTSKLESEIVERVKREIADAISSLWNEEGPASIDRESLKCYRPVQGSHEQEFNTRKTSFN